MVDQLVLPSRDHPTVAILSTLLAASLLNEAILSPYLINSATAYLWMIASFARAFAISVGLFTNVR